jgi:protoporphyrinogen/coproporphyrinogen III oxidase
MSLPETSHRDVVVIGAGVSGLTFAYDLHRQGIDILVLEKASQAGGCAQTVQQDGYLFEKGPFNLLVRDPLFEDLLSSLSTKMEVVSPAPTAKVREIVLRGERRKVPSSLLEAIQTPLLPFSQKIRLVSEPLVGKRPTSADPTLGDIIRRRFGDALADNVVSAVVAGVYGGDCDLLSARACFPLLWEVDQSSRSLILGLIKRGFQSRGKPKRRWKGMVSFRGGVGSFCDAMASSLGESLALGQEVISISRTSDGYQIETWDADGKAHRLTSRYLILSTDLPATRALLRPWAPGLTELLDPIESVSLAVVNLGYGPQAFDTSPLGFGFLVPKPERDLHILGALWASSVFPHHAPNGCHSIRIFVGGVRSPQWAGLPEEELTELAIGELSRFITIREQPQSVFVSRWSEAVPQMVPGHCERIASIEQTLGHYPGLAFVGNYTQGVSVNDCVVNARKAAKRIIETLKGVSS